MENSTNARPESKAESPLFQLAISDVQLQQILKRIEENIELRRFLRPEEIRTPENPYILPPLMPLPDSSGLAGVGTAVGVARELNAPFFGAVGDRFPQTRSSWRRPLYWLLNLPLRVFGRRQAALNQQMLSELEHLTTILNAQAAALAAQHEFLQSIRTLLQIAFDPETSPLTASMEGVQRELRELRVAKAKLEERLATIEAARPTRPQGDQLQQR